MLFTSEKLNIVDQQGIQRSIRRLELAHGVVSQGTHHIADKPLRMDIRDPGVGFVLENGVTNTVHQVSFAKPHAAVYEQGVIGAARIDSDLVGGCARQLVALTLDKTVKSEGGVKHSTDNRLRWSAP